MWVYVTFLSEGGVASVTGGGVACVHISFPEKGVAFVLCFNKNGVAFV